MLFTVRELSEQGLYLTYEGLKPCRGMSEEEAATRLYLTYEGLKQPTQQMKSDGMFCLYLTYEGLKLAIGFPKVRDFWGFVSYLWGIETHPILILFLRRISFVSYLWGIETLAEQEIRNYLRHCLYLTYEGLKPWQHLCQIRPEKSLYLTYEGLKLTCLEFVHVQKVRVCILPMRDWNRYRNKDEYKAWNVCILPMRDWNIEYSYSPLAPSSFVSYLWGIETNFVA